MNTSQVTGRLHDCDNKHSTSVAGNYVIYKEYYSKNPFLLTLWWHLLDR